MKQYVCVAVAMMVLASVKAQVIPGGEHAVEENDGNVEEAKRILIQEAEKTAKTLENSPTVELKDIVVKKQTVAGTRYNFSFKAVYTYQDGKQVTKSCTASLIKPLRAYDPTEKITFIENRNKEKIHCE